MHLSFRCRSSSLQSGSLLRTLARQHTPRAQLVSHAGRAEVRQRLANALERSAAQRVWASLMLIGIDAPALPRARPRLRREILRQVARELPPSLLQEPVLAWDECTLASVFAEQEGGAEEVVRHGRALLRVLTRSELTVLVPGLRVSIGIGLFPEDGATVGELVARAGQALADLRAVGGNAVGFCLRTAPARRQGI